MLRQGTEGSLRPLTLGVWAPGNLGLSRVGLSPQPLEGKSASAGLPGPGSAGSRSGHLSLHVTAHIKGSSRSKAFTVSTPVCACCRRCPAPSPALADCWALCWPLGALPAQTEPVGAPAAVCGPSGGRPHGARPAPRRWLLPHGLPLPGLWPWLLCALQSPDTRSLLGSWAELLHPPSGTFSGSQVSAPFPIPASPLNPTQPAHTADPPPNISARIGLSTTRVLCAIRPWVMARLH